MSKKSRFLECKNIQRVTSKLAYINHSHGGKVGYDVLVLQIPKLMKAWKFIDDFEKIETLMHDDFESELEWFNDKFVKEHKKLYEKEAHVEPFKRTHELDVYGYRSLDYHQQETKMVDNSMYRYNNTIPLYQKVGHMRHYDRDNDGLYQGRSIDTFQATRYGDNMTKLLTHINKPYTKMDDHHMDYSGYTGHLPSASSSTTLMFTGWNIPPESAI